jgi:serine/threonine-protein kinase HipA
MNRKAKVYYNKIYAGILEEITMNRKAKVYYNKIYAGILEEFTDKNTPPQYHFTYDKIYLADNSLPPISLTLPKRTETFLSENLFPFFYGLLAEGRIKELQCRQLKIDERDHFGRLLKTACNDCIGAVTIEEIKS